MMVKTETFVNISEANQNFSKVTKVVDNEGFALILKNNKPLYVVVNYDYYNEINSILEERKNKIEATVKSVIMKNMEAFKELAK